MDFIRFSGELFIYYVLIALGGGVLTAFMVVLFESIGIDAESFIQSWLLPCGAAGAVLVASWLVEAKQSVIENMAPVLTRLFTPLFAAVLVTFLGALLWTGGGVDFERDLLIQFNLLLVVVLGLLLYSLSARDPRAAPDAFDVMQVVLVVSALLADAVALWAIATRITEFGFSPNRMAALGANVILLVNLAWSAVLYVRFLRGRGSFTGLEQWQTELPARLCRVGGDRRDRLSAGVRLQLSLTARRAAAASRPGRRHCVRATSGARGAESGGRRDAQVEEFERKLAAPSGRWTARTRPPARRHRHVSKRRPRLRASPPARRRRRSTRCSSLDVSARWRRLMLSWSVRNALVSAATSKACFGAHFVDSSRIIVLSG